MGYGMICYRQYSHVLTMSLLPMKLVHGESKNGTKQYLLGTNVPKHCKHVNI